MNKTKTCFKCKRRKLKDQFYKNPGMLDGRLNKCKVCTKSDVRKNYRKNIDHYTEYEQDRAMLPHRVAARKKYQKENPDVMRRLSRESYKRNKDTKKAWAKENREKLNRQSREWAMKNKKKRQAHGAVSSALRSGKIVKSPCKVCGKKKVQGHHKDYSKPLVVVWLCVRHHADVHRGRIKV